MADDSSSSSFRRSEGGVSGRRLRVDENVIKTRHHIVPSVSSVQRLSSHEAKSGQKGIPSKSLRILASGIQSTFCIVRRDIKFINVVAAIAFALIIYQTIYASHRNESIVTQSKGLHTHSVRNGEELRSLCRSGDDYVKGSWVWNESIVSYPYLSADDYEWSPICTDLQRKYSETGVMPDFLRYQWRPDTCDIARFDRLHMCRVMDGKTIGIIGDSISQQFAHAMIGLMLGGIEDEQHKIVAPDGNAALHVPLCPNTAYNVTLIFYRWNKYHPNNEEGDRDVLARAARLSDYLVLNWGTHYQPWHEMESATYDFINVLKEHWPPKKTERLFWRSTVVAHGNCSLATEPDQQTGQFVIHDNPAYNTDAILVQDREIVKPLLQASSLNVTFLRVEESTLLRRDGHRVIGHGGKEDCLHYCEPGPIDSWVELFYHHIALGIAS